MKRGLLPFALAGLLVGISGPPTAAASIVDACKAAESFAGAQQDILVRMITYKLQIVYLSMTSEGLPMEFKADLTQVLDDMQAHIDAAGEEFKKTVKEYRRAGC